MHSHYARSDRSHRKFRPHIKKKKVSWSPGAKLYGLRLASFNSSRTSTKDECQIRSNEIFALNLLVNSIGETLFFCFDSRVTSLNEF